MATQALRGTYNGQYSVHMVWLCECKPLEPMLAKEQGIASRPNGAPRIARAGNRPEGLRRLNK